MQADDDRKRNEEIWLLRERIASVKRPILWQELITRVGQHIATYRESFPTESRLDMRLMKPNEAAFTVKRSNFPCVKLHAEFLEHRMIELVFEYRRSDSAPTLTWAEHIDFTVDDLQQIQFMYQGEALADTDEAARIVLAPILKPGFAPPESARPVPGGLKTPRL